MIIIIIIINDDCCCNVCEGSSGPQSTKNLHIETRALRAQGRAMWSGTI